MPSPGQPHIPAENPDRAPPMLRLLFAFVLLNIGLLALEIPRHGGVGPNRLALEALVLCGLFALLPPHRWTRVLAALLGLAAAILAALSLADALARLSLNRPLNLGLDYPLVMSVYHLTASSTSPLAAALAGVILILLLLALVFVTYTLLLAIRPPRQSLPTLVTAIILVLAGVVGFVAPQSFRQATRAITPAVTMAQDQWFRLERTRVERKEFAKALDERKMPEPRKLAGLEGRDVIIAFIESYGVSAVFDTRYAPTVQPSLQNMETALAAANLHVVSGALKAPVFGGQSWLAHATVLSGLWIDSHLRYELLLQTGRTTMVDDFAATGHQTAVIVPAITRPWPEGEWYGFQTLKAAKDIPYAGPAFNWVTMPDQFTWSYFQKEIRERAPAPLFATLALVSSHAPWVPILPIIGDWSGIGDGSVFRQWEGKGEAPESLWRDHDRVREHYARSVAYALDVTTAYAERFVGGDTLLIVLGDHQPARLITGPEPDAGVPVHVISADPGLLKPFLARGFVEGIMPPDVPTQFRMDRLRDWLREDFGDREMSERMAE